MAANDRLNIDGLFSKLDAAIQLAETSGDEEVKELVSSIRDMLRLRAEFTDEATSKESKTCRKIEHETYAHDWEALFQQGKVPWAYNPNMLCGRTEGQFLKSLISIQKAKRVLEVGLFTGYSALSMAEALPADGEIISLEFCDYLKPFVEKQISTSPHGKKIKIKLGDSTMLMNELANAGETFDVIFLDGNKDHYIGQFPIIFDRGLLRAGGTLLIDNAYVFGSAYTPPFTEPTARNIVEYFDKRPYLHRVMLPINDGVLMVRRLSDVETTTY